MSINTNLCSTFLLLDYGRGIVTIRNSVTMEMTSGPASLSITLFHLVENLTVNVYGG
jgi:hypothetical protein